MRDASAVIFNIQPCSIHDGNGLRTVVFLSGCNLRCYWCHNPESQSGSPTLMFHPHKCIGCGECARVCPNAKNQATARFSPDCTMCGGCADVCYSEAIELAGREITVQELTNIVKKDKNMFDRTGGGVTFSGGEPLCNPDFVAAAMMALRDEGISSAIESALCVPWDDIRAVLPYCDQFLCDLKQMDDAKHRKGTGVGNRQILENIRRLSDAGANMLLRTPIIPRYNDAESDIAAAARFIASLGTQPEYELLPFHGICESKYESMGRAYAASGLAEPTDADLSRLSEVFYQIAGYQTVNAKRKNMVHIDKQQNNIE